MHRAFLGLTAPRDDGVSPFMLSLKIEITEFEKPICNKNIGEEFIGARGVMQFHLKSTVIGAWFWLEQWFCSGGLSFSYHPVIEDGDALEYVILLIKLWCEDIAGTLSTEEAEDATQVGKLRSALESVDHKRRKSIPEEDDQLHELEGLSRSRCAAASGRLVVEGKEQYYCGVGYFPLTYDFESFLGGKKEESGGGDSCMGGKKEESGGGDSCMGEKKGSDEGFKKVMEDVVVISDDSDDDSENQKMREDENEENSAEFGEGAAETDPESEEKKIFGSLEDIVFLGDDFKNDT
ncbi:hypothetical protein GH714_017127 [Hevea brasiliensis]|uniref:Uncharacterized protein n=1 Tax=Hevea brasiliensis TaxID=3981 RepID=A0A6A6K8Y5_HEVBR|nr:hypothetical protein GH714_017127 [Hevea brasiliensis]